MGFIKLCCYIANKFWWIPWSNFRYRKVERFDTTIALNHKIDSFNDILYVSREMYKNFEYTSDGADKLWDAVCPPPYAYNTIIEKGKFKDDCDGFHSLMCHVLSCNDIPSYLTVVFAKKAGHCVLTFNYNDHWYLLDYTALYGGDSLEDVITHYNEQFVVEYSAKSKVLYNCFLGYDYKKGKFYMANPEKELEKRKKENGTN